MRNRYTFEPEDVDVSAGIPQDPYERKNRQPGWEDAVGSDNAMEFEVLTRVYQAGVEAELARERKIRRRGE
jgi:hypothetical protein